MRRAISGVRMTKSTLLFAMLLSVGASSIAASAFAQHANQGGFASMVGATDPCVLGTNVQPGACVGPVRVAPMIMSQGAVQLQPSYVPQPNYAPQTVAYAQPVMMVQQQQAPVQMAGCVPGYAGPSVPCSGVWVPAPQYSPQPLIQPASRYVPAPQYLPAPVAYAPQPQQIGIIPTSFFTGGITYGAGFPTDSTYSYGGGGFGFSTGGTRFSGVRERSPTPLIAPPMRSRHAPPPAHHHGCC